MARSDSGMGKQFVPAGRQGKSHDRGRKRNLWLIGSSCHLCFINERGVIITHSHSPVATHCTFGARDVQLICMAALLPLLFPRTYEHTTDEAIRRIEDNVSLEWGTCLGLLNLESINLKLRYIQITLFKFTVQTLSCYHREKLFIHYTWSSVLS